MKGKIRPHLDPERKTYEKNLANMKLLVSYAPFQDEVLRVRKHLEIPADGLPLDNQVLAEWTKKMDERMDEMWDAPEHQRQLSEIGARYKRGEITRRQANLQAKILNHVFPWNFLSEEIGFLIAKFCTPQNYDNYLRDYIITGRINAPFHNFNITLDVQSTVAESRKKKIGINIYTRPTNHEFLEMKREINRWSRELPRYQSLRGIDEKLTIEEWFRDRIKHDPVEDSYYKMTAREIAENLLGNKKYVRKVYDVPRDLASIRKRRFGKQ